MKFYSEKTNNMYNSVKDLEAGEKEFELKELDKKQKLEEYRNRQEKLQKDRGERAKELESAIAESKEANDKVQELLAKFNKDYGAFHTRMTFDPFGLFDKIFRW